MSEEKAYCETCRFWDSKYEEPFEGLCRRYPPKASHDWPKTGNKDWCGEYEVREGVKEETLEFRELP